MIKDNLAGQELRIAADAIDIVVDCCSGRILIHSAFTLMHSTIRQVGIVCGFRCCKG